MPDTTAPEPAPRRLEYLPLDQLVPASRNPKDHDLAGIDGSAERLGWLEPQVIDERTGKLIAGHGRLETLQQRKAQGKPAPEGIIVADDGAWLAPVFRGWSSTDDAEAEAAIIGLNRWVERGGWDTDMLSAMLDDLTDAGMASPLELVGFTADELDDLIGAVTLPDEGTDATHAGQTPRSDPATPREVQGLREVGLMFQAEHHREYQEHLAKLRRVWGIDAAPLVVLRALAEAAERGA